jgi:hypothetical protein
VPLGLLALTTAPIVYPIAQIFSFLGYFNPLWFWLDDEINDDKTNADFKVFKTNKPKWLRYYLWHGFRNTMWNLKAMLKPKSARVNCVENNEQLVENKQDNLYRNGEKINTFSKCLEMAGLKWITKDGKEGFHVFSGEWISKKYSNIGTSEIWYKAQGTLYYRFSTVRVVKLFKYKYWLYFAIGTTEKRYLLNFKMYNYQIPK